MDLSKILNGVQPEESKDNDFAPLPKGHYDVVIEQIERKEPTTGKLGLNIKLKVVGAKHANRVLFDYLTIVNSDYPESETRGKRRLKKIADLTRTEDAKKMLGKKVGVEVGVVDDQYKIDKGEAGAKKNIIWGYREFEGNTNAPEGSTVTATDLPF